MPYRPEYVVQYQRHVLSLRIELNNVFNFADKCALWLERYNEWNSGYPGAHGVDLTRLNLVGLGLIHPDFCYNRFGENFRTTFLDVKRAMSIDEHERLGKCQIQQISGEECAFNEFPEERGRLVGDHLWPYALGGPSNDADHWHRNRLLLCKNCNSAKSSSVATYSFTKRIEWLHIRLHEISIKKETTLQV